MTQHWFDARIPESLTRALLTQLIHFSASKLVRHQTFIYLARVLNQARSVVGLFDSECFHGFTLDLCEVALSFALGRIPQQSLTAIMEARMPDVEELKKSRPQWTKLPGEGKDVRVGGEEREESSSGDDENARMFAYLAWFEVLSLHMLCFQEVLIHSSVLPRFSFGIRE